MRELPGNIVMPRKRILTEIAASILELYVLNGLNKFQIAESLGIPGNPVTKYRRFYEQADLNKFDLLTLDNKTLQNTRARYTS